VANSLFTCLYWRARDDLFLQNQWLSAAILTGNDAENRLYFGFATCVDAPRDAREIFGFDAARGRVRTCVRPRMRPFTRRGPGWEFADQVQIRTTCLKHLSQSWFS
jgi:hypothetical protein